MEPYRFPHTPLHAIADHGIAHGLGDREANFRPVHLFFPHGIECREVGAGVTGPFVIDFAKVAPFEYAEAFRKSEAGGIYGNIARSWRNGPRAHR